MFKKQKHILARKKSTDDHTFNKKKSWCSNLYILNYDLEFSTIPQINLVLTVVVAGVVAVCGV